MRQLGPTTTVLCVRLNKEGKIGDFRGYSSTLNTVSKVSVKRTLAVYWGSQ